MKKWTLPAVVLATLGVVFVAYLSLTASLLPERMATHFAFDGRPDGWMPRSSAIRLMGGFGLGLPAVLVAMGFGMRFLAPGAFNLPYREFWLSPERRSETDEFLLGQMLWLACLVVCLIAGMHGLTIQANQQNPIRMPTGAFLSVLGVFFLGLAAWIIHLLRHFYRAPGARS